jgi:hypothetical protein
MAEDLRTRVRFPPPPPTKEKGSPKGGPFFVPLVWMRTRATVRFRNTWRMTEGNPFRGECREGHGRHTGCTCVEGAQGRAKRPAENGPSPPPSQTKQPPLRWLFFVSL